MNVLDKIFSKIKSHEEAAIDEEIIHENRSYIEEVQEAVNIVDSGVADKNFTELADKLGQLPTMGICREKYVFERQDYAIYNRSIILCISFSIVYLLFIPVSLGTMLYSDEFDIPVLIILIGTAVILAVNIIAVVRSVSKLKFGKRYDVYLNILKFKNIELIDDLAEYSDQSITQVVTDLEKAVKLKLIPQGHFGRNNLIFMVSDEIFDIYKEKQAIYDRYYRKQAEERTRMMERTKEIQDILNQGQIYVEKIRESNDIIKDKAISEKLDRMEKVVSMIFHEVDINPAQADKLGMFMNYYLPTTEKLLEAYIEIDEKQIKGKTLKKTKKDIEGAIDKIMNSFEGLLDKFYQEQEMNLSTDISAMDIIMKQEGLVE